jgi:hypothetical protein
MVYDMALQGAVDNLIKEIEKKRADGSLMDPQQMEQFYIQECAAQTDYDKDDVQYVYDNGQIMDFKTGEPASKDVVKAIKQRVKQLNASAGLGGQELLNKLRGISLK